MVTSSFSRIIGIDPGLVHTGWGVIDSDGHRLRFVACGIVAPEKHQPLSLRLYQLQQAMAEVFTLHQPKHTAIEEIFVNSNSASSLKLSMARGVLLALPHAFDNSVSEYSNRTVKQSICGSGRADKQQITQMIAHLLPTAKTCITRHDEADALAVAITHAHSQMVNRKWMETG